MNVKFIKNFGDTAKKIKSIDSKVNLVFFEDYRNPRFNYLYKLDTLKM